MDMRYDQLSPVPPMTKVTRVLIILCVVTFALDFILAHMGFTLKGLYLTEVFGLVPERVKNDFWLWQFFSYIFMHGHWLHLLLNMLILWYFGAEVELRMGPMEFLGYFLLCGVGAGLFNLGVNLLLMDSTHQSHPMIGASGAIFGVLAAYGLFYGNRYFLVFFIFPLKAKYFVLVIAAIELIMGVESNPRKDNVAHFAHIGGMVVGALYVYLRYVRPSGGGTNNRRDYEREKLKRQFTLIVNQNNQEEPEDKGPFWN